jgi:hypothetical protein
MNGRNVEARNTWLIRAISEGEDGEPGFFSLTLGWVLGTQDASTWTADEQQVFQDRLPVSREGDAEWISLDQVELTWAGDFHAVLEHEVLARARGFEIEGCEDDGHDIRTSDDPAFYGAYVRVEDGRALHLGDFYEHRAARAFAERLAAQYAKPIMRDIGDADAAYQHGLRLQRAA